MQQPPAVQFTELIARHKGLIYKVAKRFRQAFTCW